MRVLLFLYLLGTDFSSKMNFVVTMNADINEFWHRGSGNAPCCGSLGGRTGPARVDAKRATTRANRTAPAEILCRSIPAALFAR